MIVSHTCSKDYKEWRERVHAQDKLNIEGNAPSVLLPQVVCKKGSIFTELTVLTLEEIWTVLTIENLVEHIMLTFLCQKFKLYSFLH